MINKKVRDLMNDQVKHEFESAYLYLAMAGYFRSSGLDGMSQWMRAQAVEEMGHAIRFFDHINERGGKVELQPLNIVAKTWSSPLEAFKAALKHEEFITGKINDLVKLSIAENDHAANLLLQWFVNEQMEEEANAQKVVDQLQRIGDFGFGIHMLDKELGARQTMMPQTTGGITVDNTDQNQ